MTRHTYTHRFKNGTRATAALTDDPSTYTVEWWPKATASLVPEYLAWRHVVLEDFAERTNQRILVVNLI